MNGLFELAGYTDLTQVGVGGFGRVYRARQPAFDRTVAIKVLDGHLDDATTLRRFRRECQALGAVAGHPNIVPVHEAGRTPAGQPYLVMGFVDGGSLADVLARSGPLPWPQVAAIGVKLAGALNCAHEAGVLHRDIKPANILLSAYGEPQLADFGIAQRDGGDHRTATAAAMTPSHTPPEQFAGEPPSVATDVYALSSTLFTLLTGRPPFQGRDDESVYALIARAIAEPAPDLRPHGVPDALAAVIERGLSKIPADRPGSALALGRSLQAAEAAAGLPVTPLPVPGGAPRSGSEATPPSDAPDEQTRPFLPARPPAPAAPATPPDAGPRRRVRLTRTTAGALAVVGVVALGAAAGSAWRAASSGRAGSPAASPSPRAGTPSAPAGAVPSRSATAPPVPGDGLAGLLLPAGTPSGIEGARWAALDPAAAAHLAARVPDACFDLYRDISPGARTSLRLDRSGAATALVEVVYRAAPDSTAKAMADLHAAPGCRVDGRTITLADPATTPGLAGAPVDLGADVAALRVEVAGETFFELFARRGEFVCAVSWQAPYPQQRNWADVETAARAAVGRLPAPVSGR